MNGVGLDVELLWVPFLAGLVVLSSHVPLGREVLRRGIVFVDLAVAQVAGLGIVAVHAFHGLDFPAAPQLAAGLAALACAALLAWLERRWPEILEPLIGGVFVLAACLTTLLSAQDPHGGEHLRELLVGQILWVDSGALPLALLASVLLLLAWWRLGGRFPWLFHVCLALAVTVSVQLVGVYLVFASLIFPALASRRLGGRWALAAGYLVGAAGYAAGLLLSLPYDWPSGAVIVIALALAAGLAAGLLALARRRARA